MEISFKTADEQAYFIYHSIITMLIEDVKRNENLTSGQKFRLNKFLMGAQWHCVGMVSKKKDGEE